MSSPSSPLIEKLVDAIKGYFSITGLMLVGIYLIKTPNEVPYLSHYLSYVGGFCAIVSGSIISIWYSFHLFRNVFLESERTSYKTIEVVLYGGILVMAFSLVITIIAGAIAMSCSGGPQ